MVDQTDLDRAMAEMGRLSEDKAMCASLAHRLRTHAPTLVDHLVERVDAVKATLPFPPTSTITAVETAIFDNWVSSGGKRPARGSKGYGAVRYRAVVKVWTVPVKEIRFSSKRGFQKFEVALLDAAGLIKRAERLSKIGHPELGQFLSQLAHHERMQTSLAGPMTSKPYGEGTVFHGLQTLMIDADMASPTATLIDPDAEPQTWKLPPFDTADASSRPLTGNVILQSRYAVDPLLRNWATKRLISINNSE